MSATHSDQKHAGVHLDQCCAVLPTLLPYEAHAKHSVDERFALCSTGGWAWAARSKSVYCRPRFWHLLPRRITNIQRFFSRGQSFFLQHRRYFNKDKVVSRGRMFSMRPMAEAFRRRQRLFSTIEAEGFFHEDKRD